MTLNYARVDQNTHALIEQNPRTRGPEIEWRELKDRRRTIDFNAYEHLLAETAWLGRLAMQLVPEADRDDLVQDVLLSAMRNRARPGHLRAWLATVARNLAARRRTRERNRRAREQSAGRPESGEPSVVDSLATFATHQAVVNAVMELDEPYRSAVLLRFWEDLAPREIGKRTGVPVETARTRIKRGIEQLNRPSRGSLIDISFKVKTPSFNVHSYREQDVETSVTCDACGLEFTVFGIFASCLDCGQINAFKVLNSSLTLASRANCSGCSTCPNTHSKNER